MARIRTIKPEFWRSPDVMQLDHFQRLLYIGMWNLSDDEGRGVFDPVSIAADLFLTEFSLNPQGTITDVSCAFTEYSNKGMITVYEVSGRRYFQIINWLEHQRINRPSKSKFPAPTSGNAIHERLTDDSVSDHVGVTVGREQGTGNREQGKGVKDMSDSGESDEPVSKPEPTPKPKKKTKRHEYAPEFEEFWKVWPNARGASKFETSKKFATAVKAADVETILAGARRFASDPNLDVEFAPMPTTWLHNRRWEAGPLLARKQATPQQEAPPKHRFGTRPEDWGPQAPPEPERLDYSAGATIIDSPPF